MGLQWPDANWLGHGDEENKSDYISLGGRGHMPGHYDRKLKTACQRTIPILCTTDTTDGEGNMLVQAAQAASRMNNRLYRQLRNYEVSFSLVTGPQHDGGANVAVAFYTLPDTWFVRGAIKHAYRTYMQAHQDELAAGVKFSKWHDFTLNEQNPDSVFEYSNPALWDGGSSSDADGGWAALAADESHTDSSVTDSGGTSRGFHVFGNLANSYNIFREYANLLNYRQPADESVASDQPYEGLLDLKDADDMAEKGDQAPYDRDFSTFLPDDTTVDDNQGHNLLVYQDEIVVDSASGPGKFSTRTFTAPLGLVFVKKHVSGSESAFSTGQPELLLRMAPGSYKGVKAPSLV